MNAASSDPSQPAREPDGAARLQLTQALQRAQYAIAWERAWPHLARLLTLAGLFLTVSWAGLWLALHLPRSEWLAERMRQRWHVKRPPRKIT